MRNFNKIDIIVLVLFFLFAIPAMVFIKLSGVYDSQNSDYKDSKYSGTYFWIGLSLAVIAGILMLVFFVRTGIDLTERTIRNTNIRGIQQISFGSF